jgi:hypothetical protein
MQFIFILIQINFFWGNESLSLRLENEQPVEIKVAIKQINFIIYFSHS